MKTKKFHKKNKEVWAGFKKEIEQLMVIKKIEYGKDFQKIRFESNDDLPLNRPVKLHLLTIIIRCVFSEFYLQLFLDDALYEVEYQKCYSTKKLMFQKELM